MTQTPQSPTDEKKRDIICAVTSLKSSELVPVVLVS